MTTTGLSGLASGWQGNAWSAPIYMALETTKGLIQNVGGIGVNATSVQTDVAVDEAGDTQLVLSANTANSETVNFSSRSGTGPYTYVISGVTKTHAQNDWVVRAPRTADTISSLQAEVAYDPSGNPNQRLTSLGGYSPGPAQWTMQYFLSSTQALTPITLAGLCDASALGAGNLHNHVVVGIDHTSTGDDLELDVLLTLTGS
jgi:hypothetical protein